MDKLGKQKGFAHILMILILLVGVIGGVYLVQKTQIFKSKADVETINLSLQPSEVQVQPNQEQRITVFANTNNFSVTAVELHISYDPELLAIDIETESALPVVLANKRYLNLEDGKREVILTLGANPEQPLQGSGSLATFIVTHPSFDFSTTIQFTNQTRITALEKEAQADVSFANTTLSLTNPASPSPTSTPTPTLIPTPTPDTNIICTCEQPGGKSPYNDFVCRNAQEGIVESRYCAYWEHCTTQSIRPAWPCENN